MYKKGISLEEKLMMFFLVKIVAITIYCCHMVMAPNDFLVHFVGFSMSIS